jgi:glutamate-1-semialdehyde 2,1-aminomutase
LLCHDPAHFYADDAEQALVKRELSDFLPSRIFDVHAHLYELSHLAPAMNPRAVGHAEYSRSATGWLGRFAPVDGLFFPFPAAHLDVQAANEFLFRELKTRPQSRGLMMISPRDDAATVEADVLRCGWKGFKVYHSFVERTDTFNAEIGEFLPEWAWEIAERHGLIIMLHLVKTRALADLENQRYIRSHCQRFPHAKLILAHAARGFCAHHTVEGLSALRGLENVYFDTSAVCESLALEAILQEFGSERLMYGSDFPVSEIHGRCVALGDGFHWIYEWDKQDWGGQKPTLIGIESLRALKQACENTFQNECDLERIFWRNARELLGLETPTQTDEQALYREAKVLMPGGTQLLSKRPEMFAPNVWPPYYSTARGCETKTLNGRWLLDFSTNAIGTCLLGFAHPEVTHAVMRRVSLGAKSTLNPPDEVALAKRLIELHPWAEQARFARTGGEALAIAVRMARAATGRDVIAFCGYHGWHDWYLAANLAGEGSLAGHLLPGLAPDGVPHSLSGTLFPFAYNDLDALRALVAAHGKNLAAVVMESTRSFDPQPGFFEGVRALCDESGAKLVVDEVTIGFRLNYGGAHLKYGLTPDVAVFAKTLGNGHPMAAIIGRRSTLSAAEHSFISSSYWTESVGPAAALATLDVMAREDVPSHVARIGQAAQDGLQAIATRCAVPLKLGGHPCVTTLGFEHPQAAELLTLYTTYMLEQGFLAGGGFYPTLAHREEHVEAFLAAAENVFARLGEIIASDSVSAALQTPVKHSGFARLS